MALVWQRSSGLDVFTCSTRGDQRRWLALIKSKTYGLRFVRRHDAAGCTCKAACFVQLGFMLVAALLQMAASRPVWRPRK